MARKIGVVTGTRAEYGLLYWLMKEIQADPGLELQVLVTGMHLSPEFGLTCRQIEADGFPVAAKVEMLLSSDTPVGIAKSLGLGVIGFAEALERLRPDILVVLGDRYEILAAVQTALVFNIPVAHIHGGEITEGAIDDAIRHCLTKMSYLHFTAAEPYRRRVMQLGEPPERVFQVGAIGLDNVKRLSLLSREQLAERLGFQFAQVNFLITYHPVTLGESDPAAALQELLAALDDYPEAGLIFTKPNSDTGGRVLIRLLEDYVAARKGRAALFDSLGQLGYLSAVQQVDAVVGNSSSGLLEVPALGKPTVNIGPRQDGRLRAASVIDCLEERGAIRAALAQALRPDFQRSLTTMDLPYGFGDASVKIRKILSETRLPKPPVKHFYDWPEGGA